MVVLVGGGFDFNEKLPEVDEVNFAPRVTMTALMVNGRYDYVFSLESSQKPMFRALGTREKDKRHAVFDGGYPAPHDQMIKEVLDWLDRYQGPVRRARYFLERRRPRHPYPEASQGGVREAAVSLEQGAFSNPSFFFLHFHFSFSFRPSRSNRRNVSVD